MQIKANNLTYTYMKETPFEKEALKSIQLSIKENSYTAIIGHTGSGKSTLVQLLNGLLKPTDGSLSIGDWTINKNSKQKDLYFLRQQVGIVFQYPEHQLFHETVLQDVAYGPINFGFTKQEAEVKAKEVLELVGIDPDLYHRSPFELSGGQMRRVAIAGVLAIEPKLLILDEPTAGLDPRGQQEMMELFYEWYQENKERSIILVTHQMEDAAMYADSVLVMDHGELRLHGSPQEIFQQHGKLKQLGLSIPETVQLLERLKQESGQPIQTTKFHIDDTVEELLLFLGKE